MAILMDEPRLSTSEWSRPLILLLVAGGLFFLSLDCALLEPEESRYAEIPREMLVAGEWVVPQYHGQPYYDKPPLLYWMVMAGYSAFGVHDWTARLAPGLCGVLMVLATYVWGRGTLGARAAFYGALVLALCSRFIYLCRFVATDAPLSLCVVVALGCAHRALVGSAFRWRWWLASGFACGLGLLAKGPVTFLLVGVPVLLYLLANVQAVRPSWRAVIALLGGALLTASPWYIAVMHRDPGFAEYFFWKHHVVRYVAPFDHAKPFWFYLPDFFTGTMPWCLLLVPLSIRLWKSRAELFERRPPEILLPLFAAVWCVAFFSLSGSKRVGYVLPAFAPLALVIGEQVDHLLRRGWQDRAAPGWMQALAVSAFLMGSAAAVGLTAFAYWPTAIGATVAITLLLLGIAMVAVRRRIAPLAGFGICAALVLAECAIGVGSFLPRYAERFSMRREVLEARRDLPAGAGIACYPRGWDSVRFYLQRDDVLVFSESERTTLVAYLDAHAETLLFLRDGDASRKLLEELPSTLAVEQQSQQGSTRAFRVYRAGALAASDRDKYKAVETIREIPAYSLRSE